MINKFKKALAAMVPAVSGIIDPQGVKSKPSAAPATPAKPVIETPQTSLVSVPIIAVVNKSTVVTDAEIEAAVAAIQIQINRDFAPIWGMPANVIFVPSTHVPSPTSWLVQVLDTSDESGALGYHEVEGPSDVPIAKIFAKDDKKYNLSWTVTLSHEVLEMIGDPYIDTTVFIQNSATTGNLVAFEMCDAVEDDSFGYEINGVLVSDFILPAYFETNRAPGTKYDFRSALTSPLSIANGGYLSVFEVSPTTTGWTQQNGGRQKGARFLSKNPVTSRMARRGFKK